MLGCCLSSMHVAAASVLRFVVLPTLHGRWLCGGMDGRDRYDMVTEIV